MLYTASGVLGEAPADKRCGAYWESKSAALVAAVFVDFPKNKCNFLHKNKLDIVRRVQLVTGRRPMRRFAPGTVASIALCKSAPMVCTNIVLSNGQSIVRVRLLVCLLILCLLNQLTFHLDFSNSNRVAR